MRYQMTRGSRLQRVQGSCDDIAQTLPHPFLIRKSVHPAVREAQRKLNLFDDQQKKASQPGLTDAPLDEDCIFGQHTFNAVISFQERVFPDHPEFHTGNIGEHTWAELDKVSGTPVQPPPQPQPPLSACPVVPKTTPGTCSGRHDGYSNAAKCFPLNSWLRCADRASADVCRAIAAFNFEGQEGSDLSLCETVSSGDKGLTKAKAAWFNNTNSCIWAHWRAAVGALNDPSLPKPSGLTSEWSDAIDICRQDLGGDACCRAHVVAEQNAIDVCGSYDSSIFGKLPTDVPGSPFCSDVVRAATPGLPFAGDFGSVKDRIAYGLLRCCTF
jgi:hypothetical protein